MISLCKTTEAIKANRTKTTVFPVALVSLDAQPGLGSPTLAMLSILVQDIARQNAREPTDTYRTWHEQLCEPLHQVAERLGIPSRCFYTTYPPSGSPPQCKRNLCNCLDEQRVHLYVEAMERATISEMLGYLMAVGLSSVYRGPTTLVQKLVLEKGGPHYSAFWCKRSFLVL